MLTRQKNNTPKSSRVPMEESSKKDESEETVKKLSEKLEAEQEKSKQYLNRLKYLQADFENYRKRVEKVVQVSFKEAMKNWLYASLTSWMTWRAQFKQGKQQRTRTLFWRE